MFRLAAVSIATASAVGNSDWDAFKVAHRRVFDTVQEELERFEMFLKSHEKVKELNALQGENGPAFGITWMADRHASEMHQKGFKRPAGPAPVKAVYQSGKLQSRQNPSSINWRQSEAVTSIKNQGQCGSCWAFAATSAIESQLILSVGAEFAIELSPQQIVSCTPDTGDWGCFGCEGGWPEGAYGYASGVAGITNSFFMPYLQSLTDGSDGTLACDTDKVTAIDGKYARLQGGYAVVTDYSYAIEPCPNDAPNDCLNQDLDGFAAALEETPFAVCVNANNWGMYTGGIMSPEACGASGSYDLDHCVMATGFNMDGPIPYWIVRNSWSDTWGEDGYIYLDMRNNTCGVTNSATIPEVAYSGAAKDASKVSARRQELFAQATKGATLNFKKSVFV